MTNADHYKQFHTGDLLWDAEEYFKFGNYCKSIVDVIIIDTANALKMNLSIYQKGLDRNIQFIEQTTDVKGREVKLKVTQDPQNPTYNHYDAVFLFDKSGHLLNKDRPSPTRQ